jgi:hypothetical protein
MNADQEQIKTTVGRGGDAVITYASFFATV